MLQQPQVRNDKQFETIRESATTQPERVDSSALAGRYLRDLKQSNFKVFHERYYAMQEAACIPSILSRGYVQAIAQVYNRVHQISY